MRGDVVEAPEIEAADAVGVEGFGEGDAAVKDVGLLVESEVGLELVALGAELGLRGTGPVDFEQWTGDVCDPELKFFEDAASFGDFLRVEAEEIFVPHAAKFNPLHAEFAGSDF